VLLLHLPFWAQVYESIQDDVQDLRLSGLESLSESAREMFFKQINLFDAD
jgi:hypothetical protein